MGTEETRSLWMIIIILLLLFGGMFITYNQCK